MASSAREAAGWRAWASSISSAAGRGDWLTVVERVGWGTVLALAGGALGFLAGVFGTAAGLTPAPWLRAEAALRGWPWHLGAILPLAVAVALAWRGRRWLLLAAQVAVVGGAVVVAWGVVR